MNTIFELNARLAGWPLLINVIFWLTLVLAIVTLTTLFYTVVLQLQANIEWARMRLLKLRWRAILLKTMAGSMPQRLPRLGRGDQVRMLDVWYDMRRHLAGESAARLNRLAEHIGLDRVVQRILQYRTPGAAERRVWLQALAVRVAGAMDTERAREALEEAVDHGRLNISVDAVCALTRLDPARARLHLLSTLLRFDRWSPYIAHSISRAGGASLLKLLGTQILKLDDRTARNLLSLIELTEDPALAPLLRRLLATSEDIDETATILRALSRLGGHEDRVRVLPFLTHPEFALRAQALNALRVIGEPEDASQVLPLLQDPNWWVRYRAAQTLLALEPMDALALARLRASLAGTPGREMLDHVIAEGKLAWS